MLITKHFTVWRPLGLLILWFCMIWGDPAIAHAREIVVDQSGKGDAKTIQAAVNMAEDGDLIIVKDGVYRGKGNVNIQVPRKKVTIQSENGADKCIIDCEGQKRTRGFLIKNGHEDTIIKGFTISNGNHDRGGGILCLRGTPFIFDCIITANTAEVGGGVCFFYNFKFPYLVNCIVNGNRATVKGGGVYCYYYSPKIYRCTITNNAAPAGGGIFVDAGWPDVANCLIANNSARTGGGLYIMPHPYFYSNVTNCTIYGNQAKDKGGGIYNEKHNTQQTSVANCILWSNKPQQIHNGGHGKSAVVTYTDIQGGYDAEKTNIDASPGFVNAADEDFHLSVQSPCIDVGFNKATKVGKLDIEGKARIVHGVVDMGAYEYRAPAGAPTAAFKAKPVSGHAPLTVKFTDMSQGKVRQWKWYFGDSNSSTLRNPVHIYKKPGTYSVKLIVKGDKGSGTKLKPALITVTTAPPKAAFTYSPHSGDSPLTVQFNNTSKGNIESWKWDFGDGTKSSKENPSHIYRNPGRYTATLSVTGPGGKDTQTAEVNVTKAALPIVTMTATVPIAREEDASEGVITVYRTGGTERSLSVQYRVGGTADPGDDYVTRTGQVFIPEGQDSATIVIKPKNDLEDEGDETVILTLLPSETGKYTVGNPSQATVTIEDNQSDPSVTMSATVPYAREVDVSEGLITVYRTGGTERSLAVQYDVGGTAEPGVDYVTRTGQVFIPEGQYSATIAIKPKNDLKYEGDETVILTLLPSETGKYVVGNPSLATVTIEDNQDD